MAGDVDYARMREQTLRVGADEVVTANIRALVDKILARYSSEFTTLRELVQNAADASASKVTIKFDTLPSHAVPLPSTTDRSALFRHVLQHHTVRRLVVTNDGQPFSGEDWARLKRIAEGNPDETKIGAFGVGFYSVFNDCENPFVVSGGNSMAFFWKDNALFTKYMSGSDQSSKDTSFILDYRDTTSPLPDLTSLCKFLATSLTFVALEQLELFVDDVNVITLKKKMAPSLPVPIPSRLKTQSKGRLMQITGVDQHSAQIDAQWINAIVWNRQSDSPDSQGTYAGTPKPQNKAGGSNVGFKSFFTRLTKSIDPQANAKAAAAEKEAAAQKAAVEDLCGVSGGTVFLRVSTVAIKTNVGGIASELERATKKAPPKQTEISLLTTPHDETTAALSTTSGLTGAKMADIFASVIPTAGGRIFIGFPTSQTTGLHCHVSAPALIPTVERENVDLSARHVSTWNIDMLRIAGAACRILYASEMAEIKGALSKAVSDSAKTPRRDEVAKVAPNAVNVLQRYTWTESTPSPHIGSIIGEGFWDCSRDIDILSTRGVLRCADVRVTEEDMSFIETTPLIPKTILTSNEMFIATLFNRGFLQELGISDIKLELERHPLSESQGIEFLRWLAGKVDGQHFDRGIAKRLLDSTVISMSTDEGSAESQQPNETSRSLAKRLAPSVLDLRDVNSYADAAKISASMPLPPYTIPTSLSVRLTHKELQSFGWVQLSLVTWLMFLVNHGECERELTTSAPFASHVLQHLSKGWEQLPPDMKTTVIETLSHRAVIPTKQGLRKPGESYFSSVKLFKDLPQVQVQGVKERFLVCLGVRKTIELSVIFNLLDAPDDGDGVATRWSHVDLIKYLASIQDDMPEADIKRLRTKAFCPAELAKEVEPSHLYQVSDLCFPEQQNKNLGLPVLKWPEYLSPSSGEAKLLFRLGLKRHAFASDLFDIMGKTAGNDWQRYNLALNVFFNNVSLHYYLSFDRRTVQNLKFLPVEGSPEIVSPSECFTNEKAARLGFRILRADLHNRADMFGVRRDPDIETCAATFLSKPHEFLSSRPKARLLFEYFADRSDEIGTSLAARLGESAIVPYKDRRKGDETTSFIQPRLCYIGSSHKYDRLVPFVDFGTAANLFLLKVGAKHQPTTEELAQNTVRSPADTLNMLQQEGYLELLRSFAAANAKLKENKALWQQMKKVPFLLGYRDVVAHNSTSKDPEKQMMSSTVEVADVDSDDEEELAREWSLQKASDIVIVDQVEHFRRFKDSLHAAPEDERLEAFYTSLGTPFIGSLVDVRLNTGTKTPDRGHATQLRARIIERSRLFFHECSHDQILRDHKWLDRHLKVEFRSAIQMVVSLKTRRLSYSRKTTAALEGTRRECLCVTADFDQFEVARQLVQLLLKRPQQRDALAFEKIMFTRLTRLRDMGYNVERIIRRREYESRIANEQMAQEERRRLEAAAKTPPRPPLQPKQPSIPGAFEQDDSPSKPKDDLSEAFNELNLVNDGKKLFDRLKGHLGWNQSQDSLGPLKGLLGDGADTGKPQGVGESNPAVTRDRINRALKGMRAYNGEAHNSRDFSQTVDEVKASYCDRKPGHSLERAGAVGDMPLFISRDVPEPERGAYVRDEMPGMRIFGAALEHVAASYGFAPGKLHVFADARSSSIAFNADGAVFVNYEAFKKADLGRFARAPDGSFVASADAMIPPMIAWWSTVAHELAHNLYSNHDANHTHYMGAIMEEFFVPMAERIALVKRAG
ncbi:hypothetical protein BDY21DRAFT_416707 [Lineolata rhizophorae]|uniref:Sacsin/Nov domain-containing protein n=1 Tax=Lineolata rhizophorae TaxID=578093 RepID=A0A6A6NRP6_9PEZI|nr:hypothetical protein BDY21DRAFT_416707 [Lineolata rhizophorae]